MAPLLRLLPLIAAHRAVKGYGVGCNDECVNSCPLNWEEADDKCFYWGQKGTVFAWTEAESYCRNKYEGGHLVSISNDFTHNYLAAKTDWVRHPGLWIGATDLDDEGNWTWSDCSKWNYTRWDAGEPNNGGAETHAEGAIGVIGSVFGGKPVKLGDNCACAKLYDGKGLKWDDKNCGKKKNAVCSLQLCPETTIVNTSPNNTSSN